MADGKNIPEGEPGNGSEKAEFEDSGDNLSDGFEVLDDNMTLENASQCTMTTVNQDQVLCDEEPVDAFQDISNGSTPSLPELPNFVSSGSKHSSSIPKSALSTISSIDPSTALVTHNDIDSLADVRDAINNRRAPVQSMRLPPTVAELTDRIEILSAQLAEKCALEDELEREKEDAKGYRRQLDETMAKYLEMEEQFEEYRNLNKDGFSDVGDTPLGFKQLLAAKDIEIERLGRDLRNKTNELAERSHCNQLLVKELETATGLLAQINEQRREDQAYMDGLRCIYERRIRYLVLNYARPGINGTADVLECPLCNSKHSTDDFTVFEKHVKECYHQHRAQKTSTASSPVEWMQ